MMCHTHELQHDERQQHASRGQVDLKKRHPGNALSSRVSAQCRRLKRRIRSG